MTFGARVAAAIAGIRFRGVVPLVLMTTLIVAVGAYTAVRQDAFLTELQPPQPAARDDAARARRDRPDERAARRRLRRVGRRADDAVRRRRLVHDDADDVDRGADPGRARAGRRRPRRRALQRDRSSASSACPRSSPRSARSASSRASSLWLRDHPEGTISSDAIDTLTTSWSFVPIAFIGVVVLALLGDLWLYRTRTGMALRAVGLDETSSRRLGIRTDRVVILAFVACSRDGVDRRLLPRRRGPDRLPDHRQPGAREHRRRPCSAEPASRAAEARSSGRCSRRSSCR